jgi:hypothetical protein
MGLVATSISMHGKTTTKTYVGEVDALVVVPKVPSRAMPRWPGITYRTGGPFRADLPPRPVPE